MTTPTIAEVAGKLSDAQRHFVLMSSDKPMHPYDIDSSGLTAKAMVVRGIAYRTLCRVPGQWKGNSFSGYGLTPLGLAVREYLQTLPATPAPQGE